MACGLVVRVAGDIIVLETNKTDKIVTMQLKGALRGSPKRGTPWERCDVWREAFVRWSRCEGLAPDGVIGGGARNEPCTARWLSTASPHKGWSFRGAFSWSPPRRLSAVLVILFSLPSAHTTAFGSQWTKIRQIRQHRSQQVYRSAPLSMYPEKALLSAGPLPTPT